MIFKELQEIYKEDASLSYVSDKKLQKCLSATDVSTLKKKKSLNHPITFQNNYIQQKERNQKSKELSQFAFCLKLKMISMLSLFEDSELNMQKIQSKDAKQILSQLTQAIKKYIKDSTRKLTESQNKNKSFEIQVINLESCIKTLTSQAEYQKKQIERAAKAYAVDVKKLENKVKQKQKQKELVELKAKILQQLTDEQSKNLSFQQKKISELIMSQKQLENDLFQKQKNNAALASDFKVMEAKKNQQIQRFKASTLKTAEGLNNATSQISSLKQIMAKKEQKIQEMRSQYNKLYWKLQKSQEKVSACTKQNARLQAEVVRRQEQYKLSFYKFQQKQSQVATFVAKLEQHMRAKQAVFRSLAQQVKNMLGSQTHQKRQLNQLQNRLQNYQLEMDKRIKAQLALQKQQFQINIKSAVLTTESESRHKIQFLEDQIQALKLRLANFG